jgi:protein ImuB
MVVCLLLPRLSLIGAVGDRRALLSEAVALAPEAGGAQRIGDTSAAAEAFGVVQGMGVGEALARCPELRLVPPDPQGVRALWAGVLDRLEGIGASVESDRPGEAFFAADGLRGIHGGRLEDVLAATRRVLGRAEAGRAGKGSRRPEERSTPLAAGIRLGAGPSRFTAYAAASRSRTGRRGRRSRGRGAAVGSEPSVVPAERARAFLAPLPVGLLRSRPELAGLPDVLEQLGVRTLGELADLPAPAVAERFGPPGLLALDLARAGDTPLEPRRPAEPVVERLALPEAASGPQLERAVELLVARVLARLERRGRSLRGLALFARFVEGGTWRARVTLRQASADPGRLRLALAPRIADLPAPAESIGLEVEAFGPPAHDQERLLPETGADASRARIGEAVRQARQAAGGGAALRVLEVDPGSRVPERRAALAPYPVEDQPG